MTLFDIAFAQSGVETRLALVRVTLAFAAFVTMGSPVYRELDGLLVVAPAGGSLVGSVLGSASRRAAPAFVRITAIVVAAGLGGWASTLLLALSFAIVDRWVAARTPRIWSNYFHVHTFGLLLALGQAALATGTTQGRALASFAVTAMQLQCALVYWLAGVSKLRVSGWSWFRSGRTLLGSILFRGTPLGRRLVAAAPARRGAALATGVFELGAPVLVLWPALHPWWAAAATSFHAGTLITMRISFWHLWIFYPALFVDPRLLAGF